MELKIEELNKTYPGGTQALKNVTLNIKNGLFGLLGPNGAGKSTLMRTIATLQNADSGSIWLDNVNVLEQKDEVRKWLGYLPQEFGLYPNVSAIEMLDHLAILKGIASNRERSELIDTLLKQTNLYDIRKKRLGGYSGGMKQRFGIAQALIGNPKIIIVDEPTAGLDPTERNRFLNLLSEIGENIIVILSTHIVDDVKELCSQMAIIDLGQVKFEGHPVDALKKIEGKIWKITINKEEFKNLSPKYNLISNKLNSGNIEIHVWNNEQMNSGFELSVPELEDAYFAALKGLVLG